VRRLKPAPTAALLAQLLAPRPRSGRFRDGQPKEICVLQGIRGVSEGRPKFSSD
jgi:hypothetical protein